MFEVLVREAAARYGLGDKALPMLQLVLHHMVGDGARGLATFLEKFKTAGLGPIVQSWLGGGPVAKPISNAELEQAVGGPDELIDTLSRTLGADRENITSALGYMLPALVGKLTPGGSLPSRVSPEVQTLAAQGGQQLQSAATSTEAAASTGRAMRWLPWIVVAVIVILALGYCSTRKAPTEADSPAASEPVAPAPASEAPAPTIVPAPEPDTPADDAVVPADEVTETDADTADTSTDTDADEEDTSGVDTDTTDAVTDESAEDTSANANNEDAATTDDAEIDLTYLDGRPVLKVFFATGAATVPADFAESAQQVRDYLSSHESAEVQVSGFTDATGDAQRNQELAKERAQAVLAALVMSRR